MTHLSDIKKDFPIFDTHPHLIYLDSTATSLKPRSVIQKITEYYLEYSANVHRGIYALSEKATEEYEKSRVSVSQFINASRPEEIIFTRSTTEGINLVAYSLGREIVRENDELVTTQMEHHSNFVPWQVLASENGAVFKVIGITKDGYLSIVSPHDNKIINVTDLETIINKRTKIFAITYISNVLGTINPVKEIIAAVKKINPNVITIVDAAQAVPQRKVDVQELGCDFLVFSSHKMLGPTGVGVLWGKYELLDRMFPFQYGGEMILEVGMEETTFKKPPHKFEAGTPHIAGVIGLNASIEYLEKIGLENIKNHEKQILAYALKSLKEEFKSNIHMLGPANIDHKASIISFTLESVHPHDIAQILDESNIAVRAGHHCAMPLHAALEVQSSARASFYIYNTLKDVDTLVDGLKKVTAVFSK